MTDPLDPTSPAAGEPSSSAGTWLALVAALVTLAGSLALSLALQLKACPLCFYQRTFVMGVVAVLLMGLLVRARPSGLLAVLALPLAVGGLAVAGFHVYLELTGKLECPLGVLGMGTAPQQSLAALTILTVLLLIGALRPRPGGVGPAAAGVVLGALLAVAAIASAPPLPSAPAERYKTPLDICRPPYRGG